MLKELGLVDAASPHELHHCVEGQDTPCGKS